MNMFNFLAFVDAFINKHGAELDLLLDEGYIRTQFRRFAVSDIDVDIELGLKERIEAGVYDAWIFEKNNNSIEVSQQNGQMQIAGLGSHDVKIIYKSNGEITPIAVELKAFSDIGSKNSTIDDDGIKKDIFRVLTDRYVCCLFVMDEVAFNSFLNPLKGPKRPIFEWLQEPSAATIRDFFRSIILPYTSVPLSPEWRAEVTNRYFGESMAIAVRRNDIENTGVTGPKVRYWIYAQRADEPTCAGPINCLASQLGNKYLPPTS